MRDEKKCLIIDGNNLIYRAYYVSKDSSFENKLIRTFLNIFFSILKKRSYQKLLMVFDKGKDTFRKSLSSNYKKGRKEMPEELVEGLLEIKQFFNIVCIRYEESDQYEADDIIATFIEKFSNKKDWKFQIVSQDKDLFQLLDENVSLIRYQKGKREDFTEKDFLRMKGFSHKKFFYFLSLIGDKSDNIKGVNGIGEVRAKHIVSKFEGIEETFENLDLLPEEMRKPLINSRKLIEKNFSLILLNRKIKIGEWENYNFSIKKLKENKEFIEFCKGKNLTNFLL